MILSGFERHLQVIGRLRMHVSMPPVVFEGNVAYQGEA